jgi:hypothetical protein
VDVAHDDGAVKQIVRSTVAAIIAFGALGARLTIDAQPAGPAYRVAFLPNDSRATTICGPNRPIPHSSLVDGLRETVMAKHARIVDTAASCRGMEDNRGA